MTTLIYLVGPGQASIWYWFSFARGRAAATGRAWVAGWTTRR